MTALATPARLREWADDSAPRFSPLAEPVLVLDAAGDADPAVLDWLRQLPCPSVGVAADPAGPLAQACDTVVRRPEDAAPLVANIRRSPLAAAVFVQTLRLTAGRPVAEALDLESLGYALLQGGPEFARWLHGNRAAAPARRADDGPAVVLDRDGDTLSIELNRASNRNALNVEMRDALNEALQLALADDSIRRVRVRGRGRCFSVGGDLAEFGTLPDPASAHAIRRLTMPGRLFAQCAARLECHVHGACIGSGVELPAFARRVVASADAFFHMPELKYGLLPGGGGCVSIPGRIGRQRTAWWVLSGKRIDARTALAWGLVDRIEPAGPGGRGSHGPER